MEVAVSYLNPSAVDWSSGGARVRLSGARERPRVRYRARVLDPLRLREALLALHDVVLADFRPLLGPSREEWRRWLRDRVARQAGDEARRLDPPRRRFLRALWTEARGGGLPLDPVCSVHPDVVCFEALSRDGSTWGRVAIARDRLEEQGPVEHGTTNVDFTPALHEAVRRLRSIWPTELALGPLDADDASAGGLELAAGASLRREKQVPLPPGWVRGFLQLGAAALLPGVEVALEPVHAFDLLRFLRAHKARTSPRALRFELEPGRPAELVLEPWERRFVCHGSRHDARERRVIRVWGRQRLVLLERALPLAEEVRFRLLGRGLPWLVAARGGGVEVTLGLSGWTKQDWSTGARFEALVARAAGSGETSPRPLQWLAEAKLGTTEEVAAGAGVEPAVAKRSLVAACAAGQVARDPWRPVWRHRPLLPAGELPPEELLLHDPALEAGRALVAQGALAITGTRREPEGGTRLLGRAREGERVHEPVLLMGDDGRVAEARCSCFEGKRGLDHGLCAHQHGLLLTWEEAV